MFRFFRPLSRCLLAAAVVVLAHVGISAARAEERSFWLHASLGLFTQRNYFGPKYPATPAPTPGEVKNAAAVLAGTGANRLYLIYHREMPLEQMRAVFAAWKAAVPVSVDLVPALVLRMYDAAQTPVFAAGELAEVVEFCAREINPKRLAIYDIAKARDQFDALATVRAHFGGELIRLGIQPDEPIDPMFGEAVADTWSAMCHGTRNEEDWLQPGFGADTLQRWVKARNGGSARVAWDLVVVAWDYSATPRGGYPGYDDAMKNMPLPKGRTERAAAIIREVAAPQVFAGFSSDLYILHENSRSPAHDGKTGSFYETLKRGESYEGYYGEAFREVVALYRRMAAVASAGR